MHGQHGWRGPAALTVGAALSAAVLTTALGHGWAEWIFFTPLLAALGAVLLRCASAWREAFTSRSAALELARLVPDEVARAAVACERVRLMAEITSGLREHLEGVAALAREAEGMADPTPVARRIHALASEATSQLRRQLGLMREDRSPPTGEPAGPGSPPARPQRVDVLVAGSTSLLAVVETLLWPSLAGTGVHPVSVLLTGLAAATVVGRRVWPEFAATACAGVFLLGLVLSAPVRPALWFLVTVGGLLWTLGSRRMGRPELAAAALLGATVLLDVGIVEPDNLPFDAVAMLVALTTGLILRAGLSHIGRHRAAAAERAAELDRARRRAVEAERGTLARELHDTVSHAVGLIAVQAAAAQVAWERDPATARACLSLVRDAALAAVTELGRLPDGGRGPRQTDLHALVDRIRSAGTPVELHLEIAPGPPVDEVAYRVAQEALTNIVRHAPGARAVVRVVRLGGFVRVEVSDDGPGGPDGVERGYGLVGLAERVGHAGGTVACRGNAAGGWTVTADLPLVPERVE